MAVIRDNIWGKMSWTAMRIRKLRESSGMTQTQFADWLGTTRVHVAHLESGFRPAGPQTMRLLQVLAERVKANQIKSASSNRKGGKQP
jgi:DNA-binding transcriptional regulator YiaG